MPCRAFTSRTMRVGGHVLNPGPKHLALGLRHAVDLRHHGDVGQREHGADLQRQVHAAGGLQHDQAQPAVHVRRTAEAQPGGFHQQHVAVRLLGPTHGVAQHHDVAMVGAQLAGVDLAGGNAEFLGQQFVFVGVLHVELQEGHAAAGLQQLARGVTKHRGLAGRGRTGANGDSHATSCNSSSVQPQPVAQLVPQGGKGVVQPVHVDRHAPLVVVGVEHLGDASALHDDAEVATTGRSADRASRR